MLFFNPSMIFMLKGKTKNENQYNIYLILDFITNSFMGIKLYTSMKISLSRYLDKNTFHSFLIVENILSILIQPNVYFVIL